MDQCKAPGVRVMFPRFNGEEWAKAVVPTLTWR